MLQKANNLIKEMENKILGFDFSNVKEHIQCVPRDKEKDIDLNIEGDIKVGVDLGTSNIVMTVLDKNNKPIVGAMERANVVRDGIVVDYINAVSIVKKLKAQVEKKLGREILSAATAIPPGIIKGNIKVIKNVVEAAGIEVTKIIDEPEAAAKVLDIENGAVVDVGGGTTGISIFKNGKVIYSADEPTGGTHFTLVTAGNFNMSFEEAEEYKLDVSNYDMIMPLVRPVIEKMADITLRNVSGFDVECIYLVGGTCCLKGIEEVFQKYTSIKTVKPNNPLLATPMGIAMSNS